MISIPIVVRVWLSTLRPETALRELIGIAGHTPKPHREGFMRYEWEFSRRESADLFAINARLVPGVSGVDEY